MELELYKVISAEIDPLPIPCLENSLQEVDVKW